MEPTYEIDNPSLSYQTKLDLWATGFGLQMVDNLEPSRYMVELAQKQIEGEIEYQQIYDQITKYHDEIDDSTREADIVSLRIVELLSSNGFKFAPSTLKTIHRELFYGVLSPDIPLGEYRHYNITKKEAILEEDSVVYDDFRTIPDSLAYDFDLESRFNYQGKTLAELADHLKKFMSGIWQIHPFGEGNTRTVTVFMIKYLRYLGFEVDNAPFKQHSRFFRDALVLDNAKPMKKRPEYLSQFFGNILLGNQHDLSLKRMYQEVLSKPIPEKDDLTS